MYFVLFSHVYHAFFQVDIPGESYPMSMALLENFLYIGDRYLEYMYCTVFSSGIETDPHFL